MHSNPNVVRLALKLTDLAIKNGGEHFCREVAAVDFASQLGSMARDASSGQLPPVVASLTLRLIQSWAIAFRGKPHLDNMYSVYASAKASGVRFPASTGSGNGEGDDDDPLHSGAINPDAMIDTLAPAVWTDSVDCERCRAGFSFTNRKHHCRACGLTMCNNCSARSLPLPHLGIPTPVRVCDGCYERGGKPALPLAPTSASGGGRGSGSRVPTDSTSGTTGATTAAAAALARREQDDLARAIAESLADANDSRPLSRPISSVVSQPAPAVRSQQPAVRARVSEPAREEEEDPDLAAAIAESLAEMKLAESRTPSTRAVYRDRLSSASMSGSSIYAAVPGMSSAPPAPSAAAVVPSQPPTATTAVETAQQQQQGLTADETETIALFSAAMARLEPLGAAAAAHALVSHREYGAVHARVAAAQPRVLAQVHEALGEHRALEEAVERMAMAMSRYEDEVRARMAAAGRPFAGAAPPPPASYGAYHAPPPPSTYGPMPGGPQYAQPPQGVFAGSTPLPPPPMAPPMAPPMGPYGPPPQGGEPVPPYGYTPTPPPQAQQQQQQQQYPPPQGPPGGMYHPPGPYPPPPSAQHQYAPSPPPAAAQAQYGGTPVYAPQHPQQPPVAPAPASPPVQAKDVPPLIDI
ncbi:hypothetical protein BC828DRAFT_356135 [Blastocladiella britannica]|nr:hypothetical protein BC828DRAFT_356135 [Blastocladiella britannica]